MRILKFNPVFNINSSHRKEVLHEAYVLIDAKNKRASVEARFYRTAKRDYCCLWIHGHGAGSGWTDGNQNYCFMEAVRNAGITLEYNISESNLIEKSLVAIGKEVGIDGFVIRVHA